MYREPFLIKFFLFSIRFSIENQTDEKLLSKTNYTQRVISLSLYKLITKPKAPYLNGIKRPKVLFLKYLKD